MAQKPQKSLKDQNRPALFGVLLANIAVFYLLASSQDLSMVGFKAALSEVKNLISMLGIGAVGLVGIFNGVISTDLKDRLVYWRWRHALPGHRAFTVHGPGNSRVDLAALQRKLGTLPADPDEQNRAWYRLFKAVDTRPEIFQGHRNALLTRDCTGLAFLFLVIFGVVGFLVLPTVMTALAYFTFLATQYLVMALVARNYGTRMVVNTLALYNKL